jgi:hypothetical protein
VPWEAPKRFWDFYPLEKVPPVRFFFSRHKFTPEDAIGSQDAWLQTSMRVTNGIQLGCSLLLPVRTVNSVQTQKVPHPGLPTAMVAESLQDWQVRSWCSGSNDISKFCGKGGEAPLTTTYPQDNTTVPADGALYMRQAYFATVSWTDANIGAVLFPLYQPTPPSDQ